MTKFEEITGGIAIEMGEMTYIQAKDNGLFTLGETREIGMVHVVTVRKYHSRDSEDSLDLVFKFRSRKNQTTGNLICFVYKNFC